MAKLGLVLHVGDIKAAEAYVNGSEDHQGMSCIYALNPTGTTLLEIRSVYWQSAFQSPVAGSQTGGRFPSLLSAGLY